MDLDLADRLVEIQSPLGQENFYLPYVGRCACGAYESTIADAAPSTIAFSYDKLVIACGSVTSTHGVPGLENAFHLKTVHDVRGIRQRIIDNLEEAALPSTDAEKRKRLLSFVVCGGQWTLVSR